MPNCPEVLNSFHAIYAIGAVVVPINFLVGQDEIAYIYQDTGAETVISSLGFLPTIEQCGKKGSSIRNVILIDDQVPDHTLAFQDLVASSSDTLEIANVEEDQLAALIYTSGTTGRPKGVMHTHTSLYENAKMQKETLMWNRPMTF